MTTQTRHPTTSEVLEELGNELRGIIEAERERKGKGTDWFASGVIQGLHRAASVVEIARHHAATNELVMEIEEDS